MRVDKSDINRRRSSFCSLSTIGDEYRPCRNAFDSFQNGNSSDFGLSNCRSTSSHELHSQFRKQMCAETDYDFSEQRMLQCFAGFSPQALANLRDGISNRASTSPHPEIYQDIYNYMLSCGIFSRQRSSPAAIIDQSSDSDGMADRVSMLLADSRDLNGRSVSGNDHSTACEAGVNVSHPCGELTDPDMVLGESLLMICELVVHVNETRICKQKILEYYKYLGTHSHSFLATGGDIDTLMDAELQSIYSNLHKQYVQRREEVEDLEIRIKDIAFHLRIEPKLPPVADGPGSPTRVKLLKHRLDELELQRRSQASQVLATSVSILRTQLHILWSQLFLDLGERCDFENEPLSFELFEKLRTRVVQLESLKRDRDRRMILHELSVLKGFYIQEERIRNFIQDRSSRAKILKMERILDEYLSEFKPIMISELQLLVDSWKSDNPGETFYFDGFEISQLLAQEAYKAGIRQLTPAPE